MVRKCTVKSPNGATIKELYIKIKESMCIANLKDAISYYMKKPKNLFRVFTNTKNKQIIDQTYDSILIKDASIL